jgi:tetratricopeptide (TPR) repeat protein
VEKMRRAVELNPRYARGYLELGDLLQEMRQEDEALEAYLQAYAGLSEEPELNLKLGEIYVRRGQAAPARRFLQKVLDTAPPESAEAMKARAFLEDLKSG